MSQLIARYEWKDLPWRKIQRSVWKLQKRIYRASQRGDVKAVRRLQKLMMRSWAAKCLAVRRVTQENRGKKTAGVDGIKMLSPEQRLDLVKAINTRDGIRKAKPVRRVWIDKPGRDEKRPLGIPTMYDRAMQGLVKQALEPEWEARFEPRSYGFRPGRSYHDAVVAIYAVINKKPRYVLDADISQCFDRINHKALVRKLNTYPYMQSLVKAWLKSGCFDNEIFSESSEGTPQGGVISPLLANIALHGMEKAIGGIRVKGVINSRNPIHLIRYADDFVILHEDAAVIAGCRELISEWLKGMGLELKEAKTRITHTLNPVNGKVGFDFLGFHIRQYEVGKHGSKRGYKTIIKPSEKAVKVHVSRLGKAIRKHKAAPQEALIRYLNPIIRGWANSKRSQCSKQTFGNLDAILFRQLWRWATRRHPDKSKGWVKDKYFHRVKGDNWRFSVKREELGAVLLKHAEVKIVRHIIVKDKRSPYDGEDIYWSQRLRTYQGLPARVADLLHEQNGKCAWCKQLFRDGDKMEIDHKIPRRVGGKDTKDNRQLLHLHCHDIKTRYELSDEEYQLFMEWLDENPF